MLCRLGEPRVVAIVVCRFPDFAVVQSDTSAPVCERSCLSSYVISDSLSAYAALENVVLGMQLLQVLIRNVEAVEALLYAISPVEHDGIH